MSEETALAPTLERLGDLHGTYHDSMETLREEKIKLGKVRRNISRQITPRTPLIKYFKRNWTPLSNFLDEQIMIVTTIGKTLYDMATTCEEDRGVLLDYVTHLEERVTGCQTETKALEEALRNSPQAPAGVLERITYGLRQMDLQHEKQRATLRINNGQDYLQESAYLLHLAAQAHHVFSGAAETAEDRRIHLEATSETCAKLIALGRTSVTTQDILTTIDKNSQAVYKDLNRGFEDIKGFFRKLKTLGYKPNRPRIRVTTPS